MRGPPQEEDWTAQDTSSILQGLPSGGLELPQSPSAGALSVSFLSLSMEHDIATFTCTSQM